MPVVVRNCIGLLLYVLASVFINSEGAPITCEAGSYIVGESASITCNFRTDISAGRRSFIIQRFSSEKGDLGEDVLVCHWVNQKYQCIPSNGYTFDGNFTNRVKVRIPVATNSHAGLYKCSFVSGEEADDIHACDLSVNGESAVAHNKPDADPANSSDRPPNGGDGDKPNVEIMAILICIAVLTISLGAAAFLVWRRRRQKRDRGSIESGDMQHLLQNKEIHRRLDSLKLFKKLKTLMRITEKEINCGLDSAEQSAAQTEADISMQSKADLKMYPICLPPLDNSAVGDFLVVEIRSKSVKISDVNLRKRGASTIGPASYMIKPDTRTGNQLFEFIVESIDKFVRGHIPLAERRDAVLVTPYPCQQTSLEEAKLVRLTQEFSCQGVENQDLRALLRKSLDGKNIGKKSCRVKIVAIVNDVISTVMSVAYQNPDCRIGMVVGSGLNACYVESWGSMQGSGGHEQDNVKLYNTEVGALGENQCLDIFRTEYDRKLDNSSEAPKTQILEKMVSWTYIGEIVRLILEDLRKDDLLLESVPLECSLFQRDVLTVDQVAQIDSDGERTRGANGTHGTEENTGADGNSGEQKSQSETERILRDLGADQVTEEDLNTVRDVCRLVIDRAGNLAGAVVASLINRLNQPGVVVVVDGELDRKLPRFNDVLYTTAHQLVKSGLKDKFYLVSSFGRGDVGAVRIAAAAKRQSQSASTSQSQ